MKNFFRSIFALLLVAVTITAVSCSRDSDDGDGTYISGSGNYSIKATTSDGVISIVTISADGTTTSLQPNTNPFTSPSYKASNFAASVSISGGKASTTLTVELIKDGNVVKTATSQGQFAIVTISN